MVTPAKSWKASLLSSPHVILAMSTTIFSSAIEGAEPAVAATRSITRLDVLRLIFCSLCDFTDDQSSSRHVQSRAKNIPYQRAKGNCYFTRAVRLVHYILASEGFNLTIRFGLADAVARLTKRNTIPADTA